MSRVRLRDSVVVVTGAGSGIGAATARRCAGAGAMVIVADIDEEAADRTATACRERGGAAHGYRCDVADTDSLQALHDSVIAEAGPVDVLVNNAGVGVGGDFLDNTEDDWTWLRSINLDGVVNGCRVFGRGMVDRRAGHVVNIASGAGYLPNRRMALYCASKAGVVMFSRCLRADWASTNVGVSVICPGVINTPILHNTRLRGRAVDEKSRLDWIFRHSHSPDTVAKAVVGAVEHNRAMVSVGLETQIGYHALRLAPMFNGVVARA